MLSFLPPHPELLFLPVFSRSAVARVFSLELLLGCPDIPAKLLDHAGLLWSASGVCQ